MRWPLVIAFLCSSSAAAAPSHTEVYLGTRMSLDRVDEATAAGLDNLSFGVSFLGGDWTLGLEAGGLISRALGNALPRRPDPQARGLLFEVQGGTHIPFTDTTVATTIVIDGREHHRAEAFHSWGLGGRVSLPWRLHDRVYWAPAMQIGARYIPSTSSSGLQAMLHNVLRFRVAGPVWFRTTLRGEVLRLGGPDPATWLRFEGTVALAWVGPSP